MPLLFRSFTLAALVLASAMVAAHEGGGNAEGCHHGSRGYHCHRRVAPQPQLVPHSAANSSVSSLGDASGGWSLRDCANAMLACDTTGTAAPVAGRSSARAEAVGQQPRGRRQFFETDAPSLLMFVVLSTLILHAMGIVQERRTRHRS